VFRARSSW